jgi:lipoprotein-releasing system permease protein
MTTAIGLVPKMQKFKVLGLLHTGYYEYDSMTAYTNIPAAAAFFGLKTRATGLEVRLDNIALVSKVAEELRNRLGFGAVVRTYAQMNQTLFSALKLEKFVMFLILVLIVLVASLNIASTLIVHSVEKTRDIGILKAMGATPSQIRRIFLAEGLIIGGFGIAMGLLLGFTLCYAIVHYPIVKLPSDIYYLSRVPVDIQAMDVMAVSLVGILLAALATLYPARKASLVDPVEAIHYG